MAFGKNYRADGRKSSSSSYCMRVSIAAFIALCLVGVWMVVSSSIAPGQYSGTLQEKKNEVKKHVTESNDQADSVDGISKSKSGDGSSIQFEDNPGDLPDDATKGDTNLNVNQEEEDKSEIVEKQEEKSKEQPEEENKDGTDETGEDKTATESENEEEKKDGTDSGETKEDKSDNNDEKSNDEAGDGDENVENKKDGESDRGSTNENNKTGDLLPSGAQSELLKESTTQNGGFSTQAKESKEENALQKSSLSENKNDYSWKLCNTSAGPDYIPCLDNLAAIRKLPSTMHYEHRERHCPDNPPTCLVPLPAGYKPSIQWPTSREKIWYNNVPHSKLAKIKGHQNWVKVSGDYLTFPGGGTQFKNGALHYIDVIQESVPDIAWGKRSRVVLDVGCGVASFGGFLFERDVLTLSLAPKDEHEAQVQFALERGIPAISAVMGTKRLPYPGRVFDIVHCARCRVPWHIEGGKLLLELNRLLRPGGFFVWSATPIYRKVPADVEIWEAMKKLTKAMCWEVVSITNDPVNEVGIAVYRKPTSNKCYEKRSENDPPLCQNSDEPNAAWNVALNACLHKAPEDSSERGSQWPEQWPARLDKTPYWLSSSQAGVYGKPAPDDFAADNKHWKHLVTSSYQKELGINWSTVRNVMDMRAVYGGFAAALKEFNLWVMNVVSVDAPDTLPIIFERGLFGIYHDWCESFSTYPRTYDVLHADHLFSVIKKKCSFLALVSEADRILRPNGTIIVRDNAKTIAELENLFKSLEWDILVSYTNNKEGLLCAQKSMWRPVEEETVKFAIA